MRRFGFLFALSLLGAQTVPSNPRDQFLDVAKHLRAFPPDADYEPDRGGRGLAPGAMGYWALLRTNHSVPSLLELLKDPDPKIRTLAAAALAAKGDPRLLRHLGPLLEDQSPTFDFVNGLPDVNFMRPSYGHQTVALAILTLVEKRDKADFDRYWANHANLEYCADWFEWQRRHGQFALARQQILGIPSPDRELITLWIGAGRSSGYAGFSEAELLTAARDLGRDSVLAILRGQPPGNDPDITPRADLTSRAYLYGEMARFLLAHAKELLRPSDVDVLLRLEEENRNRKNSQEPAYGQWWWPVAAASLRPENAALILDAAEKHYPDATEIPLARWRIDGPEALPEILRWFYRSADAQKGLTVAIVTAESKDQYKPLVERILSTPDRLRINGEAMGQMAQLANEWKVNWDDRFVDWIFAQTPDPNPFMMGPPRRSVVETSGVARKLVWDPRFPKADSQLLYDVEQCLVGSLRLTRPQATRLDELIRGIDQKNPQDTPESILQEIRGLLRQGTGDSR
jgi:hypothetical protein